ncbi:MAG: hypothetical protein KC493_16520 [Bacteriovoracaceae bacterium]|nr:hypothetical protein [Bacteriovoracaceae bacterium]
MRNFSTIMKSAVIIFTIFYSTLVSAYGIKYTKVKQRDGDKVIRAEIINRDGHVVATGHSGTEGGRKSKKAEALEEAVDDLEENED